MQKEGRALARPRGRLKPAPPTVPDSAAIMSMTTSAVPWAAAVCAGFAPPAAVTSCTCRTIRYRTFCASSRTVIRPADDTRDPRGGGVRHRGRPLSRRRRPTVMLQSSGLGNSLNALTSLLMPYRIPVLTIISMRGEPANGTRRRCRWAAPSAPIFDAIGIPHETIASAEAAADTCGGRQDARSPRGCRARACCRGG